MEDKITSWFNHLYRKSYALYVIANIFAGLFLFGSLVAIIVVTIFSYLEENKSALSIFGEIFVNTIASIVGVLLAYFLYRFLFLVGHHNEDKNKVSYSNADMWKQYGTEYRHQFTLHDNHNFTVYFEKLLKKGEFTSLKIMDDPNDYFSLDPFIKNHFFDLNDAHVMSETTNSVTVRLKEVIPADANGVATIKTMRSTYLSHLLTNRALDYELKTGVTIRSLFENTNHLVPLQRSRFSNHLGVNALVFLQNGVLLLPERGKHATVAKEKVTASIATRIKMENKNIFKNTYVDELTDNYITEGCIKDSIAGSIMVDAQWLQEKSEQKDFMKIDFLGLSRDIYEGGKPTLFYAVYLNLPAKEYLIERSRHLEKQKKDRKIRKRKNRDGYIYKEPESIDEVKTIHLVKWDSITMCQYFTTEEETKQNKEDNENYYQKELDKGLLSFSRYIVPEKDEDIPDSIDKMKTSTRQKAFEQNLIANFWFYKNCQ